MPPRKRPLADADADAAADGSAPTPPPPPPNAIPLKRGWQLLPPGDVLVGYFPDQLTDEQAQEARRVLGLGGGEQGGEAAAAAAAASAVGWAQRNVRVFGRVCPQPRLVSYWADDAGLSYTYSGLTLTPRCWNDENEGDDSGQVGRVLRGLRAVAERVCRADADDATADASARALLPSNLLLRPDPDSPFFNSCLLNLYRTGSDSIGWHADNEPLFGDSPVVASVSLGRRRDFFLRRRQQQSGASSAASNPRPRYWCPLGGDGDVLVMAGKAQEEYLHAVPPRKDGDATLSARGCVGVGGAASASVAATASLNDARRVSLTFRRVVGR